MTGTRLKKYLNIGDLNMFTLSEISKRDVHGVCAGFAAW